MSAKTLRAAALLTVVAALVVPSAAAAQAPGCTPGTTVETVEGPVCGVDANGVTSYLGIPYAAPPTGERRWESPQPATPWTSTLQATEARNPCPQPARLGSPSTNEDCLTLDVQVPPNPDGGRLPVMVEIHGGGFLLGSPRDGAHLAVNGGVIYVAMRYRLGILGFMAHRALGAHSGNYGLQDQQAALRWVQRNIDRFGGNPRNVTIFGQSAGGASVCAHAVSPAARGLFRRGISESGFYNSAIGPNEVWQPADCKSRLPSQRQAEQSGAAFAAEVGCGEADDAAACLRDVPVQTLLDSAAQTLETGGGGTIAPTVNGTTLPMSPAKAFATGKVNDVGLMIGADRDEINGGVLATSVVADTAAEYRAMVRQKYGRLAPAVFALYPLERFPDPSPFLAMRTIVADADSVCPALAAHRRLAQHVEVFAWEGDNPDAPRTDTTLPLGAFHDTEARFTFPRGDVLTPNQATFGKQVTAQWTGYARTGSPMVDYTPRWTPYSAGNRLVMSLMPAGNSALTPASTIAMQHNCGFWNSVAPRPR